MMMTPLDEMIAAWPIWTRLLPAAAFGIALCILLWLERKEVR
jgi:hypothetical protein